MDNFIQNIDQYIFLIPIIIGVIFIFYNLYIIRKGRSTNSWTKTDGKITKSELGILKSPGDTKFEYTYRTDIEYEYTINDKKFTSDKAFFGDKLYKSYNKKKSLKILDQFPVSKPVDVFYNPMDHNESVLIKGSGSNRYLNVILGFVLIILGALIEKYFDIIKGFLEQL